jgi:hypothetical protein
MSNPFEIIKDSSIWQNSSAFSAVTAKDPYIRIGIVKKVFKEERTSDIRYLVQIQDRNDSIEVSARMMRSFGGVYNYEDIIHRGYKIEDKPDSTRDFTTKAGDAVLVAFLNGEAREAVILGGITHPARKVDLDISKGPQYKSEFNGIEKVINSDGEYIVTFKGQPTNLSKLLDKPSKKLEAPKYDADVGTSFFKFDKTGSFEVSDNAKQDKQNFKIDKKAGTVEINAGKISLKMTKKGEKVDLKAKELSIKAETKIAEETKDFSMKASSTAKIDSPKIAFGSGGVELLDLVSQLADLVKTIATENSTEVHPTAVGPSGPPNNAGAYTSAASKAGSIKSKVDSIKGSL